MIGERVTNNSTITKIVLVATLVLGVIGMLPGAAVAADTSKCAPGEPSLTVGSIEFCGMVRSNYKASNGTTLDVNVFQGIRYASAKRWQSPEAPTFAEKSPIKAQKFGSKCPQKEAGTVVGSEDCLFLNIWAPALLGDDAGADLPVMVFIHGGAFVFGSGNDGMGTTKANPVEYSSMYDGSELAARGVIVVTLNYRLGALGFLAYQGCGKNIYLPGTVDGTYGIQDQVKVLEWVRDNIAQVGGDKDKVTIFGESAGAMSVGLHLFSSPAGKSLFQAAIMESNPMNVPYRTPEESGPIGGAFLKRLCAVTNNRPACDPLSHKSWAYDRSVEEIVDAQAQPLSIGILSMLHVDTALSWAPTIKSPAGSPFLVGQPLDGYGPGMTDSPKPYVFGTNMDEGALFADALGSKTRGYLPNIGYVMLLGQFFPGFGDTIKSYKSNVSTKDMPPYPYDGATYKSQNGLGRNFQALAKVLTDFAFRCGTAKSADNALDHQGNVPSYGYMMTQKPEFDVALGKVALRACDPNQATQADGLQNVCHIYEIPYVFHTMVNMKGGSADDGSDAVTGATKAASMIDDWALFAKTHSFDDRASTWPVWDGSAKGATVLLYGDQPEGYVGGSLYNSGNCGFWENTVSDFK